MRARLEKLSGVTVSKSAANLTEAYHEAEHHPPAIAVFGKSLTLLPEFEVLHYVLRALHVRITVFVDTKGASLPAGLTGQDIALIDESMSDAELHAALTPGARPAPVAPASRISQPTGARAIGAAPGRLIMIGSSTGGVEALIDVLSNFDATSPPTMLVQHTGGTFSGGLARLLDGKTNAKVLEAEHNMVVKSGMVVLAPGDAAHLQVQMQGTTVRCKLVGAPEIGGHRPAVDALFRSGVAHAPKIAAAILTGMGKDGAEGLADLRKAGARTFGQDQETSLVYGMPKVAADIGAVERQLPLGKIGPALISASSERTVA
ncbi:MAG: CheB methylesterase domain-containing protein [Pseudomonadota bacterium]